MRARGQRQGVRCQHKYTIISFTYRSSNNIDETVDGDQPLVQERLFGFIESFDEGDFNLGFLEVLDIQTGRTSVLLSTEFEEDGEIPCLEAGEFVLTWRDDPAGIGFGE